MKNLLTVSVGIPVYNEENNIGALVKTLLAQRQVGYRLLEILIFADGCTDSSVKILKSYKTGLIKLAVGRKRLGQQQRQNQILSKYRGDVLVLLEADTLLHDRLTLNKLVASFSDQKDANLAMVVGTNIAVAPNTFFEKIMFNTMQIKQNVFSELKNGANVYTTGGHNLRAFSRILTCKIVWPKDVPEDAYLYFKIKELNMRMARQMDALTYMRNVTNLEDRLKQSTKYASGKKALGEYFPGDLIKSEYDIPKMLLAKNVFLHFLQEPFWTIVSIFEQLTNFLLVLRADKTRAMFNVYPSTKTLISKYNIQAA